MPTLRESVEDLARRRATAKQLGGADKVKRQHDRGKKTARERLDLLLDAGSFLEIGIHAKQHYGASTPDPEPLTPADGLVAGFGTVDGRPIAVASYDFTVLGGSIGSVGETKATRLREQALKSRIPIVWLIDSGGARISPDTSDPSMGASFFAGTGFLFREQVIMSGVVPQVAAMVGPGAAGTAYIPGLADFVPMVKGTSSMALGGPYLVKAAVGEEISEEELGGSQVHNVVSGCADLEVESDEACIQAIKDYLSYFPSSCESPLPVRPISDPIDRADDAILDMVPDNPRRGYDVKKVIKAIADDGVFFEMKPLFAKNIVTAFARFGGRPAGIVANQPLQRGGMLDVDSSDKAARFICLCDAFEIPLVYLVDVPGFVIGSVVEKQGIIRHGAKMLFATSDATVPKVTVILRKAFGAGYYVMNGAAYEPDAIVAWPGAEISVMGPEGMVSIFARKLLANTDDPEGMKKLLADKIRGTIDPYIAASWGFIDDVIDPRETRALICKTLARVKDKRVERPRRKHGVIPV